MDFEQQFLAALDRQGPTRFCEYEDWARRGSPQTDPPQVPNDERWTSIPVSTDKPDPRPVASNSVYVNLERPW